jgi:Kef-type K+ transport system membrane component KefB
MVGLVVIMASAQANWNTAVELFTGLAVLVAVLFGVVRPLVARLLPAGGKLSNELFALIVIGVFITAYVTKRIHIDAVFGAFLFGLCLPRDDRLVNWFSERVEPVALVVLMPVFFALAGLNTSAGAFSGDSAWLFALILATAVVGKIAGGFVGARLGGCTARMSLSIGALMNARGLMEVIVLKIGLDAGLIGAELFTMFLVMAIATTVMAGPLLSLLERRPAPVGLVPAKN